MNSKDNSKRLKIAIVYDMLYPFNTGGIEIRNYELAKRLAKRHQVHLFGVKLWKNKDIIKREGMVYHGVCRYKRLYDFEGKRDILGPIIFSLKLIPNLMKNDFDVIECSAFPYFPAFACKLYSILKRKALFITWHGFWDNYWYAYLGWKGFFGKQIEKLTAHLSKNIITVSNFVKHQIKRRTYSIRKRNFILSYNGIDFKKIKSAKKSEEKFDILFTGRLIHQKNLPLLIKAINLVRPKYPDIKLGIIGKGPDKSELMKMINKLELDWNIKFLGFKNLEKVYGYMKSSKIFVLPSIWEGFGIVVIEANACGIPVITVKNDSNAAVELIKEGKNGLIAKNNAEDLAEKILFLLNNNDIRNKMSIKGKEIIKRFDWDIISKELEAYYKSVLEKSNNK